MNYAELGHSFPTVSTSDVRKAVESSMVACKARPHAGLKRTCADLPLHSALWMVHNGRLALAWILLRLGSFFPELLMTIVGVEKPGDVAVGTFLEGEPGAAAAGIEKTVSEFR